MQVGDRVRWVPTGQEGRVMELRDGGIISVFGEDGLGNWAIYDYADRFELVNECRVKPADGTGPRVRSRDSRVLGKRSSARLCGKHGRP
jgi:hypothetical protein